MDQALSRTAEERVNAILRRHDALVSTRNLWEPLWQEIAERVSPRDSIFTRPGVPGEKRNQKIFDSTAPLALGRFAAAMEWMLTQRTQRWHKLRALKKELRESANVKRYLDDVCDALFGARYAPKANYASQQHEAYRSIGAFGTGVLFTDEIMGISLRYKSLHLSQCFIAENAAGVIDTLHRPFKYSARQATQDQHIDAKLLPEVIQKAATETPDRQFEFLHCTYPNTDRISSRRDYKDMAYSSTYVSIEGRKIVGEGGFRTFPFSVGRYVTGPLEVYGRSPAMDALPSILTLNEQEKTILRAGQRVVDPPLLLADDGALRAFDLRSAALNYGTLNAQTGEPLVKPLITNARVDIGLELMERNARLINDHFLVTLFQILVENPQMTATEAMLRAQEKGALLAPTMGRQQSDMLGPQIERELDLLAHAGQLPEMPDELIAAGGEIEIVYESPLSRAQKAEEAAGVLNIFQAAASVAQAKPEIFDKLDLDAGLDVLAEAYGTPAKVLVPPEILAQRRKDRDEAAQSEQLLNAAPVAASAAKDLMSAQSLASAAPNQRPA